MSERFDTDARIVELKAENLPPLDWRELLKEQPESTMTDDEREALRVYFAQFVAPQTNTNGKTVCVCCRKVMRGGIEGALLGGAPDSTTLEWGLAHGEAFCRVCHWPYRVYHRDIGGSGDYALIKSLNFALAVHPSQIQPREATHV